MNRIHLGFDARPRSATRLSRSRGVFVAAVTGLVAVSLDATLLASMPTTSVAKPPQHQFTSGGFTVTITDLGTLPGGVYSSAYAINDSGKIAGMAYDSSGQLRTVVWQNGQIATIPDAGGSAASVPEDMNDAGEMCGRQQVFSGGIYYGVYWNQSNQAFVLPGIPGGLSNLVRAHAINELGQIAGMGQQGPPDYWGHAAVWSGITFQSDLGFMGGGNYSEAYGINDLGDVVGVAALSSTAQHAFLWKNGQYTDLSTWSGGGVSSIAYAINDSGTIVGLNKSVASVFEQGVVSALPMPQGISAFTPAIDINDSGDIIATGSKGFPIEVGVLWRNGTPIDLGTLPGGTISRVRRINDTGEIVGEANTSNGGPFHAVKWTVTSMGWSNLGHGLSGTVGVPQLNGTGSLTSGSTLHWSLAAAKPAAPAWIAAGFSQINYPFAGGILVPAPDLVLPIVTDSAGAASLDVFVPLALPSGLAVVVQVWVLDALGPAGFAASNAMTASAP